MVEKNRTTTRRGARGQCIALAAARRGIYIGACLLLAASGLGTLAGCDGTPPATEPEPSPPAEESPAAVVRTGGAEDRDYWPTEAWQTSTPEEQAMDSAKLEEMLALVDEHDIAIDSILVVRHGYLVFEEYRNGYDQHTPHHIQSVTKSFSSMLIGIAIHEGLIEGVQQKMVDFFPDHTIQNRDARKKRITLEHLLTMSEGMDWNEVDVPYDDPRNTLGQMWVSRDAVQHVLDRPMVREPGQRWAYNSGTSILLGGILEQVTKRDVLAFARESLFGPIGIGDVRWSRTTGWHYHTDGGLWLTPRDMARFGYLMLNKGSWDGQEIVSPEWVEQSTQTHYQTSWGYGYGYQWWVLPEVEAYAATGHYEQKIYVVPRADLVVVFTANIADQDPHPADSFLERYIVPACIDLPDVSPVETYAKYGLRFKVPMGAQLTEAPIPGRDTISETSGMVQYNSLYPPLEVVNLIWDQADEEIDERLYLEEFGASIGQETGAGYEWGAFSETQKGDHKVAIRFFRTATHDLAFSGIMGLWYCPESGRVYLLTVATTPGRTDDEMVTAFQQHIGALACHETD